MAVGLTVASAFLLLLEGGLRLLPLERWEELYPAAVYPLFVPGTGEFAGRYVTNSHFRESIGFQSFARKKPPGVKRIFILGSSAALGWPWPNPAAFSGYMQRALDQVAPGVYEIINSAAHSYGSHRQLDLLTDIVAMEPDAVVVWSGNNEYVELNALPAAARSSRLRKLQRLLRYSSVYRSIRVALQATAPALFRSTHGLDLTDPRSIPVVRRGMYGRSREIDLGVHANYRTNLAAMARLIRESGAVGIFCTVPVNLSAWAPTDVQPEESVAPDALRREATVLFQQRRYGEALGPLKRLVDLAPNYAYGHFLLGQLLRALGRIDEAREELVVARDLDPRPVRALSSFERAIREIAADSGMRLVDLEQNFALRSGPELCGLDLFLDYVHPNEVGHKFAAAKVLSALSEVFGSVGPAERLEQLIDSDDWLERHTFRQADISYAVGMTLLNNSDLEGAAIAFSRAQEEDPNFAEPVGNLGNIAELRGDFTAARRYYQQAVAIDPGSVFALNLAFILYREGDLRGAQAMAGRLWRQGVIEAKLFALLGHIAFDEARYPEAIEFLQKAIVAGESDPEAFRRISESYRKLGDEPNALATLKQAAKPGR